MNIRIEVGIIRNQNEEAFWLGTDVGQTESISHIPTQITSYKGINVPLNNWEKSFFEGYLLRCGQVKRYRFYLRLYFRSVKINDKWVYFQNAKTLCSSYTKTNYILLNSQKQKIDSEGNVLSDDDHTSFSATCYCNLPQGTYYCRIIRSDMIELGDDIEFNVVSNQRIDIVVNPKLVKMEYKSNGISEEIAYNFNEPKTTYRSYVDGFTKDQPYNLSIRLDNSAKSIVLNYDISDVKLNDVSLSDIFTFHWESGGSTLGGSSISWLSAYGGEYCYETTDKGYIKLEKTSDPKKEYTYYLNRYSLSPNSFSSAINGILNCYCNFDDTYDNKTIHNCVENSIKLIYNVEYSTLNHIWHSAGGLGWQLGYYRRWYTKKGEVYNYYFDEYQVSTIKNIHPKITRSAFSCNTLNETFKEHRVWFSGDVSDDESESQSEIKEVETNREFMILCNDFIRVFNWLYGKIGDILKTQGHTKPSISSVGVYPYYQTSDGVIEAYSTDWITHINNSNNPVINDDSSIVSGFIAAPIVYIETRKGYEHYFE